MILTLVIVPFWKKFFENKLCNVTSKISYWTIIKIKKSGTPNQEQLLENSVRLNSMNLKNILSTADTRN